MKCFKIIMASIFSCLLAFSSLTTDCNASELEVVSAPLAIVDNTFYAIRADGELVAWGDSFHGATGKDDDIPSYSEANPLLPNAVFVDGSMKLGLAIDSKQTLWAWGTDGAGRLLGTKGSIMEPIRLLDDVVEVRPGLDHCIALKNDGSVWGWGDSSRGQLGILTKEPSGERSYITEPICILDNVKAIATDHMWGNFAIKEDGSLWAWGQQNIDFGPIWETPTEIMKNICAVSISSDENDRSILYMIGNDGNLWRSSFDIDEELYSEPEMILEQVNMLSDSCAITNEKGLWVWGHLASELSLQTDPNSPTCIMEDAAFAAATVNSLMAIRTDGTLFMYNYQNYQHMSDPDSPAYSPLKIGDGLFVPEQLSRDLPNSDSPVAIGHEQEVAEIIAPLSIPETNEQIEEDTEGFVFGYWVFGAFGILLLVYLVFRFSRKSNSRGRDV